MDATTRWETEAIRASSSQRSGPPRPSAKRSDDSDEQPRPIRGDARWVTLKEAEAATGIPSNTIRKWVRKDTVDSYLESDGQLALRMVDLDSLLARAKALGRTVQRETTDNRQQTTDPEAEAEAEAEETTESKPEPEPPQPEGTMLVPVDAWNKMLSQLGNLHEAGQQLAEARERAAKAETESVFLRERLAEMRQKTSDHRVETTPEAGVADRSPKPEVRSPTAEESEAGDDGDSDRDSVSDEADAGRISDIGERAEREDRTSGTETTTYWRYLTTGWRDRKRRSRE